MSIAQQALQQLRALTPRKPRQMHAETVLQEQRLGRATCSRGSRRAHAQKQAWQGAVHE